MALVIMASGVKGADEPRQHVNKFYGLQHLNDRLLVCIPTVAYEVAANVSSYAIVTSVPHIFPGRLKLSTENQGDPNDILLRIGLSFQLMKY